MFLKKEKPLRVFFTLFLSLTLMPNAFAQEFHYRPLREFTDTLSFLMFNFDNQHTCFEGKPLSYFLDIYGREMKIKDCATMETSPFIDPNAKSYIQGVWILCTDDSHVNPDTTLVLGAYINIFFEPPYDIDDVKFCQALSKGHAPEEITNKLKDLIVKEVGVYTFDRRKEY